MTAVSEEAVAKRRAYKAEWQRKKRKSKPRPYVGFYPLDELLIELDLLVGTDTPASIAMRLGYDKPKSLTKRLRNNGYSKLASLFDIDEEQAA